MASKFLSKYKLSTSINSRVQDFEYNHPINKSIKACQIYQDADLASESINSKSQYRMASQQPRVSSSVILEPIQRPTKHGNYFKSFSGQEDYDFDKEALKFHNETRKSPRKEPVGNIKNMRQQFKIRSPRNMLFS